MSTHERTTTSQKIMLLLKVMGASAAVAIASVVFGTAIAMTIS